MPRNLSRLVESNSSWHRECIKIPLFLCRRGAVMRRLSGLYLGIGILLCVSDGPASAIGTVGGEILNNIPHQSLVIQAKQLTSKQKCRALNRCRQKYTHCENKLTSLHKLADLDEKCVKPYQKCINASFGGFDFFFDRWFNPSYLDCKKY